MSEETRYVSHVGTGGVKAGKYHLYRDCGTIKAHSDDQLITVNERESMLLGLGLCVQCRNRQTGGPAIEAIKELLWEIDASTDDASVDRNAWVFMNGLKERGFYIASRRNNQEVKAVAPR